MQGLEKKTIELIKGDVESHIEKIKIWKEYCDVLQVVSYHEHELNRKYYRYEDRGWENE